jgi:CMP-2-keto-3-deoxyoctulosonic acid synthetase
MLLAETGQPSILHTVDAARRCRLADRVLVATDDREILEAVQRFGAEAVMTAPKSHQRNGPDRRSGRCGSGLRLNRELAGR